MHMVAECCGARSDLVRRAPVQFLEFGDPAVVVRLVAVLDVFFIYYIKFLLLYQGLI